ncbi:hypothetical protein HFN_1758 [Helicobacter fennelliae MRY12-0050]|uniref:Uncharacterized protein n=1 Tax=Helicobacter fennelliae MRY12-0050 TaxID=1325130 RepID=T1CWD4_9HELI|nr:hypothetical protein HFN_1758 [Helicobacter fennelliae MRY12-0050]
MFNDKINGADFYRFWICIKRYNHHKLESKSQISTISLKS